MDPVSPNVNTIRTVLPKSNREAAHSPPRHRGKVAISTSALDTLEPNMSSSLPQTQSITSASSKLTSEAGLSTVDDTSTVVYPEKTNPKMIKQRSFSSKTIYRSSSGMTTSRLSERTDSGDLNPNITQRMSKSFSLFPNYRK
jgi:hypothetical protein